MITTGTIGESTQFLDAVPESMHAHRKKVRFFLDVLAAMDARLGRSPTDADVLELGCGNGRIVSLPFAEQGYRVTGVDLHRASIESASEANRFSNTRFVCADVTTLALGNRFDAVILSDVLEHVRRPDSLLEVAVDHLSPTGVVLISVPNGYGGYELEQRLLRTRALRKAPDLARRLAVYAASERRRVRGLGPPPSEPAPIAYNAESGHVQFFTLGALRRLLADAELAVVRHANGALFGGDLSYFLFVAFPGLVEHSLRVADRVPPAIASTWYVACVRKASAVRH